MKGYYRKVGTTRKSKTKSENKFFIALVSYQSTNNPKIIIRTLVRRPKFPEGRVIIKVFLRIYEVDFPEGSNMKAPRGKYPFGASFLCFPPIVHSLKEINL
jgi:hypothetical protein